jgi:hypothetical protein
VNTQRILKLTCLLLLMVLPNVVQAQFTYTTNADGSLNITGDTNIPINGVVLIPSTISYRLVRSIGDWAFYATGVTNVVIPASVTSIGDGAFFDCESLTNVTLGSSVTNIGDWAFAFCPSLISVCCRGNAPSLGGDNVFYGNLATVYYLSGTTGWGPTFDGHPAVLWNPPVPFTYTLNTDGITLTITGYTGSNVVVTIPSTISFLPVSSIGELAFFETSVTSVTIPDSVTSIGEFAFNSCSALTNITIPNTVTSIGYATFVGCGSLTSITIPNSVISLGDVAFANCTSLTSVTIGNSVTNIGEEEFLSCNSLTNVTIGNSVTSIGDITFAGCIKLTSIIIPNSVTSIGVVPSIGGIEGGSFEDTGLTSITIPNSVTSIGGEQVFSGCTSLTNATIGNGVTNIGEGTFSDCSSLNSITIGNSVANIGGGTFAHCSSLTNVTIPASVTSIGSYAFEYCTSLTRVYFQGNSPTPTNDSTVFYAEIATVYYLPGTIGWGSTFGGLPTALWLPQVQTSDGSFGVQTNGFGFNINWASGQTVVVEASTNLSNPNWTPLATNILTGGPSYFSDPQWTNYPARFYRLNSP